MIRTRQYINAMMVGAKKSTAPAAAVADDARRECFTSNARPLSMVALAECSTYLLEKPATPCNFHMIAALSIPFVPIHDESAALVLLRSGETVPMVHQRQRGVVIAAEYTSASGI
mmetsp:Transcript_22759/g.56591  ORF Transcript_22759/g.56591 Transcript_22759/m.56591 type:complete len:115 (-) Transcript_22759:913-1257(-)